MSAINTTPDICKPANLLPPKKARRILPPALTAMQFGALKVGQWVTSRESGKVYEITAVGPVKGREVKDLTTEAIELTGPTRPLSAAGLTVFKAQPEEVEADQIVNLPETAEIPQTPAPEPDQTREAVEAEIVQAQAVETEQVAETDDFADYCFVVGQGIRAIAGGAYELPETFTADARGLYDAKTPAETASEQLLDRYTSPEPVSEAEAKAFVQTPEVQALLKEEAGKGNQLAASMVTPAEKVTTDTIHAGGGVFVDIVETKTLKPKSKPLTEQLEGHPKAEANAASWLKKKGRARLNPEPKVEEPKMQPRLQTSEVKKVEAEVSQGFISPPASPRSKAQAPATSGRKKLLEEVLEKAEAAACQPDEEDGEIDGDLKVYRLGETDRYAVLPEEKVRRRNAFRRINNKPGQWALAKAPEGVEVEPFENAEPAPKKAQAKAPKEKKASARVNWNGLGMCDYLRYAGAQGWNKKAVLAVAGKIGFSPSLTTMHIQMKAGRDGKLVPKIDKSQANELAAFIGEVKEEPKPEAPAKPKTVKKAKGEAKAVKAEKVTAPAGKNVMPAAGQTRSERKAAKRAARRTAREAEALAASK